MPGLGVTDVLVLVLQLLRFLLFSRYWYFELCFNAWLEGSVEELKRGMKNEVGEEVEVVLEREGEKGEGEEQRGLSAIVSSNRSIDPSRRCLLRSFAWSGSMKEKTSKQKDSCFFHYLLSEKKKIVTRVVNLTDIYLYVILTVLWLYGNVSVLLCRSIITGAL